MRNKVLYEKLIGGEGWQICRGKVVKKQIKSGELTFLRSDFV